MARGDGAKTRRVLVTGFEPFGGHSVNASGMAVRELRERHPGIGGRRLVVEVLPVCFDTAIDALQRALRSVRPELVICVGEAGGRAEIAVERIAINVDDARIPDNAGAQPIDRAIAKRGPTAYWSTLPIKAVVAAVTARGIPATVSQTAGTFVCNHVFYGLMRTIARRPGTRGGFIHVPHVPEQAAKNATAPAPSMPLEKIVEALEVAVATSLATKRDARVTGGATH
jgi:pyroglutamyl-peptidase